jgi:hypothetical protein
MKLKSNKIAIIILIVLRAFMIILIGPMNHFTHGHYYEEYDFDQIVNDAIHNQISLKDENYEMTFSPVKDYLNGFSICLGNQPDDNKGVIELTIKDEKEKAVDHIEVDLSKPHEGMWYKTDANTTLKKGKIYTLQFSASNCKTYPYLKTIDSGNLPKETKSGNVLLAYSYAQPTFTFQERVIIILLLVAVCFLLVGQLAPNKATVMNTVFVVTFLTCILTWNFMHNSMDTENTLFPDYQVQSETLTTGMIIAENDGEYFRTDEEKGYGLGRYYDLNGDYWSYSRTYQTDTDWNEGYSRTEPAIIVSSNEYTKEIAKGGNIIRFSNGEEYKIIGVVEGTYDIRLFLDSNEILDPSKNGSLDDVNFYNANHDQLPKGRLIAYQSQYGIHGKIFRHLARLMEKDRIIDNLHLLCSLLAAVVFTLITLVIDKKYNNLLAFCFYMTFLLSPWVVSFARNAYWVEFTWFIPMLVGLYCAWKIDNKKCRIASYIACFVSTCFKCLCGYEYISVIMMGLIAFLLVDLVESFTKQNKEQSKLIFRTIIIIGVVALLGFISAIIMHANLKGNGDIIFGIKEILEKDVLRRTASSDLNEFDMQVVNSLNASVWETYSQYFKFDTEIITGIHGNLFPLLCIIPLGIFVQDYRKNTLKYSLPAMYVVFFFTAISWFCLAKGHSFIHTHMNFVLWYFGFVQTCFYVVIEKLQRVINKNEVEN